MDRLIAQYEKCEETGQILIKRRQDHWDIVNEKCRTDPNFKEIWGELLLLMKLRKS